MLIKTIGGLGRTYRHLHRYSEILGVGIKFGFGDLVNSLRVEQYVDLGRKVIFRGRKEKIESLTRAVRLRMVLEELGPTFIKLGQALSTRPDVMPADFVAELSKLQDEVPPFPSEQAREILEKELEAPVWEVFSSIDPKPMAAASIGQVHRARLKTGEDVVVKVQRPGIRKTIEVDLEILMHLAILMERHLEGWALHRPTSVVEEFGRTLEAELDYGSEAGNMERLAAMYADDPRVYVPTVYRKTTTAQVLTMEFVMGIKADNIKELEAAGYDLTQIASLGAELVIDQTMKRGFFHADPHPGNLLILPDHVICFLDLGMMGHLSRRSRENIADLALGVVRRDPAAMVGALLRLTEWDEEPDTQALERDVIGVVDRHFNRPLKELSLSDLLQQTFNLAFKYQMRVPPDLLLLIKALSTIEGVASRLDPNFDLIEKAAPFVRQVQMEKYNPHRLAEDFLDYALEIKDILRYMPGEVRQLLRIARKGKLRIELEHEGLEELRLTQNRTNNRLSFAIVLAALIISSSVIVHAGIPPTWHDIPLIGLAGYLVAGVMGFWLLISIIRRGMM